MDSADYADVGEGKSVKSDESVFRKEGIRIVLIMLMLVTENQIMSWYYAS